METISKQKNSFEYQKPTEAMVEKITEVREACKSLAELLATLPASRETSLALTKLEEASMWANKSIVFNGEDETSETSETSEGGDNESKDSEGESEE